MKYSKKKRILIYMYFICMVILLGGCSLTKQEKLTHIDTAMGTIVQQTLYVKTENKKIHTANDVIETNSAETIPNQVMELLNLLERDVLSWRETGSEIDQINAMHDKEGYRLSPMLQEYLEIISDVWKKSEGALDVTVGEITRLWDIDAWSQSDGMDDFCVPAPEDIEIALLKTGFEKVKIEEDRIYLTENVQLDLGAVGKGIACDEVYKMLKQQEAITGAVISIGGSIVTYGEKPDGSEWKVGIQHPRDPKVSIATLKLKGGQCVSTSGDYERYVEKEGVRYHHIMDPDIGSPADSGVISVTIVSESGCLSDALSTACFVLGKEKGLELVKMYEAEAYIMDSDLKVYMTEGMDKLLVLQ